MSRIGLIMMLLTATSLTGCASFWHELQPHRLHRLNRHPAPSLDPEFTSVTPISTPSVMRAQSPE